LVFITFIHHGQSSLQQQQQQQVRQAQADWVLGEKRRHRC
jgi:hypothetical protein